MNAKYSFSHAIALLIAGALLVMPTACNDDFGFRNVEGQQIAFKLTAPDIWHNGMFVNENAPTTHCTSVQPLSGGDIKLYLHTMVADNPIDEIVAESRGTLVNVNTFTGTYSRFSLSAICYTGDYPSDESQNQWTPDYAYNLYYYTASGTPAPGGRPLLWPSHGKVRFYAFAPTVADFNDLQTDGTLTLSEETDPGSPKLTYTVPTVVTKQVDLMTVCKPVSATTTPAQVDLKFGHALTAVRIECGKNMLAGEITEVTIAGVYGSGTQVIGSDKWTPSGQPEASYTISKTITLSDEDDSDKYVVPGGTPIAGTATDNLTFMLLPQILPEDASMTIRFKDKATGTSRTLTASIGGHVWTAGKIFTYSVSPSSISIRPTVEFSKQAATDTIPYSGVWYDATYTAKAEIVQAGVETKTVDIPAGKIKFQYKIDGSNTWEDCEKDDNGLLTIKAQSAYTAMNTSFSDVLADSEEGGPFSLSGEYGEPANCYLVDKAGYYSLSLVYGNGYLTLPEGCTGFTHFPGYDNNALPADGKITGVADAVLLWQDAPDLIDPASVTVNGENLEFRIRKHTLTQGNAVLAVRKEVGGKKVIVWSWHIWVTPYKTEFYTQDCTSTTYLNMSTKTVKLRDYYFAKYNLGWCDSHAHNSSRKFSLRAVIDMSAYREVTEDVAAEEYVPIPGEFTQMEYRGSDAGDNTYYQWGRKDPMLGGIRNTQTPKYEYYQRGTSLKKDEFNMENKQLFNQYNQHGYDYRFRKNVGDKLTELHPALDDGNSHGVLIGYTIQHPYMFITNSRMQYVDPTSGNKPEGGDPRQTDLGLDPDFNFRGHWHKPWALEPAPYLNASGQHIMFNAWDAGATQPGKLYTTTDNTLPKWGSTTITEAQKDEYMRTNASDVTKTVYDPCPPGFKVPPVDAFRGVTGLSQSGNVCTITFGKGSTEFHITGVRDYALRTNEWKTVIPATGDATDFDCEKFYRTTMPAFGLISFVSTATLVLKDPYNRYQLLYFNVKDGEYTGTSSNSYGMPVRPIRDRD